MAIKLSKEAEAGLYEAWLYANEKFGSTVADKILDSIEGALELLEARPEVGHFREDLAPQPWRFWSVGPSLIVYTVKRKSVLVAYIGRSERDWKSFLEVDQT